MEGGPTSTATLALPGESLDLGGFFNKIGHQNP